MNSKNNRGEMLEESKQGQPMVLENSGKGKKLYLESYGCQALQLFFGYIPWVHLKGYFYIFI